MKIKGVRRMTDEDISVSSSVRSPKSGRAVGESGCNTCLQGVSSFRGSSDMFSSLSLPRGNRNDEDGANHYFGC